VTFEGLAGPIDGAIDIPGDEPPRGWALVLHPHPLHGGARDNKIVTTIARACVQQGLVAVRPNFRGVGASGGEFDAAVGETSDMLALVPQFEAAYPEAAAGRWVLAGFSFGTSVAAQLYAARAEQHLKVPDALLLFGSAVERFRFRTTPCWCMARSTKLFRFPKPWRSPALTSFPWWWCPTPAIFSMAS
jgi:alpha/beta superfamily hydrolase